MTNAAKTPRLRSVRGLRSGDRVHVRGQTCERIGLPGVVIRGAEAVVVRVVDDQVLVECIYRAGRRLVDRSALVVRRNREPRRAR